MTPAEIAKHIDAAAIEELRRKVVEYDQLNPMRTADYHEPTCICDRCNIDFGRAVLAELEAAA